MRVLGCLALLLGLRIAARAFSDHSQQRHAELDRFSTRHESHRSARVLLRNVDGFQELAELALANVQGFLHVTRRDADGRAVRRSAPDLAEVEVAAPVDLITTTGQPLPPDPRLAWSRFELQSPRPEVHAATDTEGHTVLTFVKGNSVTQMVIR